MSTAATALTPNDLLRMGSAGKGYELVNGELKEVEVSTESSFVAGEIHHRLKLYAAAQQAGGWAFPEGTGYCCFPDDESRVRKPDTSYISRSRLTPEQYRAGAWLTIAPDLAVEVVSPNDTAGGLEDKRIEWLDAGVREVWIVHPTRRTIHVYRAGGPPAVFNPDDTLTSPDILPGFSVTVSNLFLAPGDPVPPPVH